MDIFYYCVLLVDDDETSLFLSQKTLTKHKLADHAHTALNGSIALDFIRQQLAAGNPDPHKPNLILLDINMPVMDGFEFMEEYAKLDFPEKHKTKIVMLTSSSNPRDLDKAHEQGIFGFMNKPLTLEKLVGLSA
ncbi:MAG: response regulator [Bacteroidetes bacterium]|nr:MAG: response regulator [Bacteroidota bacterium]